MYSAGTFVSRICSRSMAHWPTRPSPKLDRRADRSRRLIGVAGQQHQLRFFLSRIEQVEHRLLGIHHRREFRENQPTDRQQILLALKHAAELGQVRLQPVLLAVLERRVLQVANHLVDVVFERGDFALCFDRDESREIALRNGRGDFGNGTHLRRQIRGELIHVIRERLPSTGGTRHARLTTQSPLHTHFAGHRRHLIGERGERLDHAVDRVGERGDFALRFHRQLALQIAVGDRRHDLRDTAHLAREVAGHRVHVIREILPRAGNAFHLGLTAELAFGTHFAGHAGHFRRERAELIDHRVDRVLELENFALHVDA